MLVGGIMGGVLGGMVGVAAVSELLDQMDGDAAVSRRAHAHVS